MYWTRCFTWFLSHSPVNMEHSQRHSESEIQAIKRCRSTVMRVSSSWMRHIYTEGPRGCPCCLEKCQKGHFLWVFFWTSRRVNHDAFVLHRTGQFLSHQKCAPTELIHKQNKAVKEGRCRSSHGPAGCAATPAVNQPVCCGGNCCRRETHGKVRALTLAIRVNETRTPGQRGESGRWALFGPACLLVAFF